MFAWYFDGAKKYSPTKKELREELLKMFGSYSEVLCLIKDKTLKLTRHEETLAGEQIDEIFNLELFND